LNLFDLEAMRSFLSSLRPRTPVKLTYASGRTVEAFVGSTCEGDLSLTVYKYGVSNVIDLSAIRLISRLTILPVTIDVIEGDLSYDTRN